MEDLFAALKKEKEVKHEKTQCCTIQIGNRE